MKQIEKLQTPPNEVEVAELGFALKLFDLEMASTAHRLAYQRDVLLTKVEDLQDLLRRLLAKLPHETHDLTVGWCAGCHAVQWCGDGLGAESCAPNCVLQEAKAILGEK